MEKRPGNEVDFGLCSHYTAKSFPRYSMSTYLISDFLL